MDVSPISQIRRQGLLPPKTAMARVERRLPRQGALPPEYLIKMMELPDERMCHLS